MLGWSACSENSPLSENNNKVQTVNEVTNIASAYMMQTVPPANVLDITLVTTETGVFNPPPNADIHGGDYTVATNMTMPNSQTTVFHLSADGENSTPPSTVWDIGKSAGRHTPTSISYGGGNTLYYTIDGQQKSYTMNTNFAQTLDDMQQNFFNAKTAYENMPPATGGTNPLLTKTDQEIKQILESQGYTVTILSGKRFEITKTIAGIETTEIFNAQSFGMESTQYNYNGDPAYSQYYSNGSYQPERIAQ